MKHSYLLLFVSLACFESAHANPQPTPDVADRDTWFKQDSVRLLVLQEYISLNRVMTELYLETWKKLEPQRKSGTDRLAYINSWIEFSIQGDDLHKRWSDSARRILAINSLSREEVDLLSKVILLYTHRIQDVKNEAIELAGGYEVVSKELKRRKLGPEKEEK